jgi:hypothetical protein
VTAKRKLSDDVEIGDISTIVMTYESPKLGWLSPTDLLRNDAISKSSSNNFA